jgi:opacity protein-like surface antigen
MKTIIKSLFVLLITLSAFPISAQNKFHIHLDYNYLLGFYEKSDFLTTKSGLKGFDLSITEMYDINKRLSAGIGVGLEKLYEPYTIFPVFVKVDYSPIRSTEKPYVYAKLGYGIGTKISNAGLLFNPGLGYKLKLGKRFGLNFTLGYHLQSIRYDMVYYSEDGMVVDKKIDNNNRNSLSLGAGFIF